MPAVVHVSRDDPPLAGIVRLLPLASVLVCLGGATNILLVFLTLAAPKDKRKPSAFINWDCACILWSFSLGVLILTGHPLDLYPPRIPCMIQQAAMYGGSPMLGVAILALQVTLWHQIRSNRLDASLTLSRLSLISPYLFYILIFIGALTSALTSGAHPVRRTDRVFFCSQENANALGDTVALIALLAISGSVFFQMLSIRVFRRMQTELRSSPEAPIEQTKRFRPFLVRTAIITVYSIFTALFALFRVCVKSAPKSFRLSIITAVGDIFTASIPLASALIFLSQGNFLLLRSSAAKLMSRMKTFHMHRAIEHVGISSPLTQCRSVASFPEIVPYLKTHFPFTFNQVSNINSICYLNNYGPSSTELYIVSQKPCDEMESFSLHVPDGEIENLRKKLATTRFPDELDEAEWAYGTPLADLKRLVAHWQSEYDWKKHEADINTIPQFTTLIEVEGHGAFNIHFVHKKSDVASAIPLLFVHGWPGHFMEVAKILPLLTNSTQEGPAFHVVAFSLPGFAFSDAPKKKGFAIPQYAEVGHKLMVALGYDEYVVQGGDWGATIGADIARLYGNKYCKAFHRNMVQVGPPSLKQHPLLWLQHKITPYTNEEKRELERSQWFEGVGMGYFAEQSTQPQTLAYSLADSPVGLLAWIYEKLHNWTDSYPFTDDEILTWVSIYWFSKAGPGASIRIYYEYVKSGGRGIAPKLPNVPLGLSMFPQDLVLAPKLWRQTAGKLIYDKVHSSGGHFAAFERPEELVGDLREMFGKGGPAYGVVTKANGYAS